MEVIDQLSVDGINTYIVSREAKKLVKVALSGLGGDELFAGYSHFTQIGTHQSNFYRQVTGRIADLPNMGILKKLGFSLANSLPPEEGLNYIRAVRKQHGNLEKNQNKLPTFNLNQLSRIQKIT